MSDKIIYILCDQLEYGTAETNRLLAYARGFRQFGYQSNVIGLRYFSKGDYKEECAISFHGNFATIFKNRYIRFFLSYVYVIKLLLFVIKKTDLIILYNGPEYLFLISRLCRCKLYIEKTECPEINSSKLVSLKNYLSLCKNADGIFVISNPLKEYFIHAGIDPQKIYIINMIVDSSRFNNIKRDFSCEKYIAYCGNIWNDTKDGILDLLKVFVEYHKICDDRKLYIIGTIKSKKLKESYDNFIYNNGLKDMVVFIGSVSPNDMPRLLINAEMLLLIRPNNKQAHYGFPTKLGEYLLSKRPVVVSNVGDINLFLVDSENAFLVKPQNIEDIVAKMKWISENLKKAECVGIKGYECAIRNFNHILETKKILEAVELECNADAKIPI